ncbi:MAG: hypothetical protein ACYDEE_00180 [Ignavibacteriaceae bacterium]
MTEQITERHIDEAFDFSSYKLEFLKNYEHIDVPDFKTTKKDRVQERRDEILGVLAGKTLTKQDIYTELAASLGKKLSTKMIDRDLAALEVEGKIVHDQHDKWEFPVIENEGNTPI